MQTEEKLGVQDEVLPQFVVSMQAEVGEWYQAGDAVVVVVVVFVRSCFCSCQLLRQFVVSMQAEAGEWYQGSSCQRCCCWCLLLLLRAAR
jgi:hypothetical protein